MAIDMFDIALIGIVGIGGFYGYRYWKQRQLEQTTDDSGHVIGHIENATRVGLSRPGNQLNRPNYIGNGDDDTWI